MNTIKDNLFEEMLNDYLPEEKKSGDIVEGILIRKEVEYSYLDLNGKKEGRILTLEVENNNIGDTIEVKVLRNEEDIIVVSNFLLVKEREFELLEEGNVIEGTVIKKVKGGYNVKIGKNEGFLPFSLANFDKTTDYTGKNFKFYIKEKNKKNITLSRSEIIEKEEKEFLNKISIDDIFVGKINQILDFGLVVDLGSINGLVHISEISWKQVKNISDIYKIGDEITVKVIEVDEENRKVKLSIKQLSENPWDTFTNMFSVGDNIDAIVQEVLDFGLVVDVQKNRGFIHVSELAWNNSNKELKKYKLGDKIEARIIEIENDKKNIKLSIKQLNENPWESVKEKYQIGEILEKQISEIFDFGLLIKLEENIEGLIHVSDLSYRKIGNLSSKYNIGDTIKFKIVDFNDEKERLVLSVKAILDDKWSNIDEKYNLGDIISGKVTSVQEYGIFVEIEEDIEAFIHKNEFSWVLEERKNYQVGDNVEFKIINIEKLEKKLGGSIKQLTVSPWKEAADQYKVGNKVKVPIVSIQENFVLVKLTDRFNGVIPKKELTEEYLKNISDKFNIGDEIEAIVFENNEKKKSIALSVKKIVEIEEKNELKELLKIYGV